MEVVTRRVPGETVENPITYGWELSATRRYSNWALPACKSRPSPPLRFVLTSVLSCNKMQSVLFIVSLSTEALSHRKSASARNAEHCDIVLWNEVIWSAEAKRALNFRWTQASYAIKFPWQLSCSGTSYKGQRCNSSTVRLITLKR